MTNGYGHHLNANRLTDTTEARAEEAFRNLRDWSAAVEEIRTWPKYAPQPLRVLDCTARTLGIAKLFYKDESQRFGQELGSFKALGAPYTVSSLLRDEIAQVTGERQRRRSFGRVSIAASPIASRCASPPTEIRDAAWPTERGSSAAGASSTSTGTSARDEKRLSRDTAPSSSALTANTKRRSRARGETRA